MNIDFIFNKLSNELIQDIIVCDSFQNYAEDKLNFIKNCSRWSLSSSEGYQTQQDYYTNPQRL